MCVDLDVRINIIEFERFFFWLDLYNYKNEIESDTEEFEEEE